MLLLPTATVSVFPALTESNVATHAERAITGTAFSAAAVVVIAAATAVAAAIAIVSTAAAAVHDVFVLFNLAIVRNDNVGTENAPKTASFLSVSSGIILPAIGTLSVRRLLLQ